MPTEDPTILSGTVRSTLDVFDEYQDAEIVGCPLFSPSELLTHGTLSTKLFVVFI